MDLWMLWVAGKRGPRRVYKHYEAVLDGIKYLRERKGVNREIYVLQVAEIIPGRKLISINEDPELCQIEDSELQE